MRITGLVAVLSALYLASCGLDERHLETISPSGERFTDQLFASLEPSVTLEARLGSGPDVPLPEPPTHLSLGFSHLDPLRLLEAQVDDLVRSHPSSGSLHALGVVQLLGQSLPRAVDTLERAIALDTSSVEVRNDYAAALIERGCAENRRRDFLAALYAALEVLRIDPKHPQAHFNLALAIDHIGLPNLRQQAWLLYLEIDPTGTWAEAAERKLSHGRAADRAPPWAELRDQSHRLLRQDRLTEAIDLLAPWSYLARKETAETLIGEWAQTESDGHVPSSGVRRATALIRGWVT